MVGLGCSTRSTVSMLISVISKNYSESIASVSTNGREFTIPRDQDDLMVGGRDETSHERDGPLEAILSLSVPQLQP